MYCPSCNAENQPIAKFCVECGIAFQADCLKGGFKNPPAAKFCQECGGSLRPESVPQLRVSPSQARSAKPGRDERTSLATDAASDGERKTLTALFADIKGSMELMEDLDPEEARACCADNNRRDEARAMLAEIYKWFTEGFDTADLKDAAELLRELGA